MSLHKQPGRPFWFCAYTSADGKRVFRSTKTKNKRQAEQIEATWVKAARLARQGKLTPETAREVIAAGVADVFTAANSQALPGATIKDWCERWVEKKRIETESGTAERYAGIISQFLESLGSRAKRDIAMLTADDIGKFRDREAKALSRSSANMAVKVLRICFGEAVRQGLLTSNPATRVDRIKGRGDAKRRAFNADEIRRILAACSDDAEWKGLVLFGIYTGQRLGDLRRLTWRSLNLDTSELAFTTAKTGRRMVLPLTKPLVDYLAELPSSDNPDAPLFARAAAAKQTGTLSNRFYQILVAAGLAEPRSHKAAPAKDAKPSESNDASEGRKGRRAAREISELSFHSLRHSAVTFLKAAGVSSALAMAIVGHESAAVSRGYTHLDTEDLRRAMNKLPDLKLEKP